MPRPLNLCLSALHVGWCSYSLVQDKNKVHSLIFGACSFFYLFLFFGHRQKQTNKKKGCHLSHRLLPILIRRPQCNIMAGESVSLFTVQHFTLPFSPFCHQLLFRNETPRNDWVSPPLCNVFFKLLFILFLSFWIPRRKIYQIKCIMCSVSTFLHNAGVLIFFQCI